MSEETMRELAESFLKANVRNHSDYAKSYEELLAEVKNEREKVNQPESMMKGTDVEVGNPAARKISTFDKEKCIKELKKFRLDISRAEGVKPYLIFNDAQMYDLLEKKPETKEQLLQVSGFGKVKVEKYGEHILKILNDF